MGGFSLWLFGSPGLAPALLLRSQGVVLARAQRGARAGDRPDTDASGAAEHSVRPRGRVRFRVLAALGRRGAADSASAYSAREISLWLIEEVTMFLAAVIAVAFVVAALYAMCWGPSVTRQVVN